MRILIPLHQLGAWAGGLDLARTIVDALKRGRDRHDIDLVFAHDAIRPTDTPSSAALHATTDEMMRGFTLIPCHGDGRSLMHAAVDANAQVIFPTMVPIRGSHVRKIGYIYDFQHADLPHLFPDAERERRTMAFSELAERSDAMFCTSEFVADGIAQRLGVPRQRILVLPFMPHADPAWFDTDLPGTQARYGLHSPYLIVCNHFWVHKDHATVLHAFAEVVKSGVAPDLHLVMTGDTGDFRDPGHFPRLQSQMQSLGIADRCHVLGLIPKHDQIALLRGSLAMLQPTRYEGSPGGMAAFQAAGLGVPTLLSDIAVNREAQAPSISHFRTGDATDLAARIESLLRSPPARRTRAELEADADARQRAGSERLIGFLRQLTAF